MVELPLVNVNVPIASVTMCAWQADGLTITQSLIPDGIITEKSALNRNRLGVVVVTTVIRSRLFGSKSIPDLGSD